MHSKNLLEDMEEMNLARLASSYAEAIAHQAYQYFKSGNYRISAAYRFDEQSNIIAFPESIQCRKGALESLSRNEPGMWDFRGQARARILGLDIPKDSHGMSILTFDMPWVLVSRNPETGQIVLSGSHAHLKFYTPDSKIDSAADMFIQWQYLKGAELGVSELNPQKGANH